MNRNLVAITCPFHGDFLQAPYSHINYGSGCPNCSDESKDNILYLTKITNINEVFLKVGITNKNTTARFWRDKCLKVQTLDTIKCGLRSDAIKIERDTLKLFKRFKYTPQVKFTGYTECFYEDSESILVTYFEKVKNERNKQRRT